MKKPQKQKNQKNGIDDITARIMSVFAAVFVLYTLFSPIKLITVSGSSMQPAYQDGDIVLVRNLTYTDKESHLSRGCIVIIKNTDGALNSFIPYIKRLVGLPGDTLYIENGRLYINETLYDEPYLKEELMEDAGILSTPVVLKEDEYIVLGDNRNRSTDSRALGVLKEENIAGVVITVRQP